MNLPRRLLALSLLAACAPASAQIFGSPPSSAGRGPSGYIDGFAVLDNRLVYDLDGGARLRFGESDRLRGGGVEARLDVVPGLFLTGEYRRTSFDRLSLTVRNGGGTGTVLAGSGAIDSDLSTIRGGAGIGAAVGGVPVYVRGEYSSLDLSGDFASDDRQHGYGVLAGVAAPLNRYFGIQGEVGYQDNGDFGKGFEYRAGGWLNVLPNLALTLHYRRTRLESGDLPGDGYLETGGAGIRFQFGGAGLPTP